MVTFRPVFGPRLDSLPEVRAWLASLDEETVRSLRDDITPQFKELPMGEGCLPSRQGRISQPERAAERVGVDGAVLEALRPQIAEAAARVLPEWQREPFLRWLEGVNRNRIARELEVSRATVRAALDGQATRAGHARLQHDLFGADPRRKQQGAIDLMVAALSRDEEFRTMAKKKLEADTDKPPKTHTWFRAIARKPELFPAWSLLLVLDDMADAQRRVQLADLVAVVPRSIITPLIAQLRAHGMAVSDGRTITIHRTPENM